MKSRWQAALIVECAAIALSSRAPVQSGSHRPPYRPRQLLAERRQVEQFTPTPRGGIDGLILTEGTELKVPPHLSTEIAYSIKPGDWVIIHGLHAMGLPLVQAVSIADEANGRAVMDTRPQALASRVRRLLNCKAGCVWHCTARAARSTMHCSRTVLPPPEAERFAALLQPGQTVAAEGIVYANALGKRFEATGSVYHGTS